MSHRLVLAGTDDPAPVVRLPSATPEIKDPNVVRLPGGTWAMYASVGRSTDESWHVGRFLADDLAGPWRETDHVDLGHAAGPCACAPAVVPEPGGGFTLYLQTDCFTDGASIEAYASRDGARFTHAGTLVAPGHHALVYDAGARSLTHRGHRIRLLLYTGCERVGCGDLWGVALDEERPEDGWSPPQLVLAQEHVPFHNQRHDPEREWALEGAEVVQADAGLYLLVGVCFLPLGHGARGSRQRVFLAAARSPLGPYVPMGCPLRPAPGGENGHASAVVEAGALHLLYQARRGRDPCPWYLRHARFGLAGVAAAMLAALGRADVSPHHGVH